ncbi:MAG: tetratricopeptide repeat protein [Candidatus Melainabacteria bacterium]|nr:tetratricopeptide repeat protein [Candidatus Melainabacteria bacterium]
MDSPTKRWEKYRVTAEQAQQEGMFEFAETAWTAALEQAEDFGDTDRRLAYTLEKMAECLWHQGKLTDAANHCKRVLKMYEKVLGARHPDVACFMGNLAMIYHARNMYPDAEGYYKKALEVKSQVLGADHPDVKKLQGNYADLLFVTNREEEAAELKAGASLVTASDWRKTTGAQFALESPSQKHPPMSSEMAAPASAPVPAPVPVSPPVASVKTPPPPQPSQRVLPQESQTGLAAMTMPNGTIVEAPGTMSSRTLSTIRSPKSATQKPKPVPHQGKSAPPPPPPPGKATPITASVPVPAAPQVSKEELFDNWKMLKDQAEKAGAMNSLQEAEHAWVSALEIAEKIGEENPPLSYTLYSLGDLKARQEIYDAAVTYHQRAYAVKKNILGPHHLAVAASANSLARLFYYLRDYINAEKMAIECIEIYERVYGHEHPEVGGALHNLATLYHVQRKYTEAEPVYKQALELKRKVFGAEHPETLRLLRSYADLLRSTGREFEAQNLAAGSTGMITGSWKTIDIMETASLKAREDRCDICNAQLGGADQCPKCGFEAAIGVI